MSQLTAIRLLDADEPAGPLLEAVRGLAEGQPNPATYQVKADSFRQVPNAPFAYWVSENIRRIFTELPAFESDERTAKQGLATADDFRFVRTAWETPNNKSIQTWYPFAKGGSYSVFFADIHLKLNWREGGTELKTFGGSVIRNPNFYFRLGMTWTNSTTRELSVRALPLGCIFGHMGPSAFTNEEDSMALLAWIHSRTTALLIKLQLGLAAAGRKHYEVGIIQRLPFPRLDEQSTKALGACAHSAWSIKRSTDTANQTSHAFYAPALSPGQFGSRRKESTPA